VSSTWARRTWIRPERFFHRRLEPRTEGRSALCAGRQLTRRMCDGRLDGQIARGAAVEDVRCGSGAGRRPRHRAPFAASPMVTLSDSAGVTATSVFACGNAGPAYTLPSQAAHAPPSWPESNAAAGPRPVAVHARREAECAVERRRPRMTRPPVFPGGPAVSVFEGESRSNERGRRQTSARDPPSSSGAITGCSTDRTPAPTMPGHLSGRTARRQICASASARRSQLADVARKAATTMRSAKAWPMVRTLLCRAR